MIVVDTNILVYILLGASDAKLGRLTVALKDKESRWLIPSVWRHEFLNVLCTMVRAGVLSPQQAEDHLREALVKYAPCEGPVELWRALELSAKTGLSGYDAQFLALAEHANCILVTEDRKLAKASGGLAVGLEEFLAA